MLAHSYCCLEPFFPVKIIVCTFELHLVSSKKLAPHLISSRLFTVIYGHDLFVMYGCVFCYEWLVYLWNLSLYRHQTCLRVYVDNKSPMNHFLRDFCKTLLYLIKLCFCKFRNQTCIVLLTSVLLLPETNTMPLFVRTFQEYSIYHLVHLYKMLDIL